MTVADKLASSGPRKLLSLDGGGVRGIITLDVLARIEAMLQAEPREDGRQNMSEARRHPPSS